MLDGLHMRSGLQKEKDQRQRAFSPSPPTSLHAIREIVQSVASPVRIMEKTGSEMAPSIEDVTTDEFGMKLACSREVNDLAEVEVSEDMISQFNW